MERAINVVIADDHAIVREGIKNLIELEDDFNVVAMVDCGKDALKVCRTQNVDILLLDINMPKMNGVEVLRRMIKHGIKTNVIVLTIHDEKAYLVETMALGVKGYVLKDADSDLLLEAIRTVHAGDIYIYPSMQKYMDKKTQKKILSGTTEVMQLLTIREIEVLKLLAGGDSNRDIAKNLYISEKTVKNHISSIFRKIGVRDRTTAALYAIKKGLKQV